MSRLLARLKALERQQTTEGVSRVELREPQLDADGRVIHTPLEIVVDYRDPDDD